MTEPVTGAPPQPADELEEVLRIVCSASSVQAQAAALGTPGASSSSRHDVRIEPTRFASIRSVALRRWTSDEFGEADLELQPGREWRTSDLERLVGPLHGAALRPGRLPRILGSFERDGLPAWAAVALEIDDADVTTERVVGVRIRTEPNVDG